MDRIELEAKKAMLAREILNTENEELLDKITDLLINHQQNKESKGYIFNQEQSTAVQEPMAKVYADMNCDNQVFERIPGLAYTREERIAAVRETMAEIRAGVPGMDSEEVYERLQELFKK